MIANTIYINLLQQVVLFCLSIMSNCLLLDPIATATPIGPRGRVGHVMTSFDH